MVPCDGPDYTQIRGTDSPMISDSSGVPAFQF
eukprot:SAG31_NODE_14025_length_831_cov_1.049180_1_plen_31_part_10